MQGQTDINTLVWRPDQTRPDQTRPDQTRPDQTRPDQTTPDQTRPDQTRPHPRLETLETKPNSGMQLHTSLQCKMATADVTGYESLVMQEQTEKHTCFAGQTRLRHAATQLHTSLTFRL